MPPPPDGRGHRAVTAHRVAVVKGSKALEV